MRTVPTRSCCLVMLVASACVFDSERRPLVDVNVAAASSYVFRGQTFTEEPVAQFDAQLQLPTKDGGTGTFGAFGNLDLTDDIGAAWASPDASGEFTQIDLVAGYGRSFGGVDVAAGLRYYDWPNGESFRFAPFPSTTEVFGRVGGVLLGLDTALTAHWDVDEVHSLYMRAEAGHTIGLGGELHLELRVWGGWSDADHSLWLYRTATDAFADVGASAGLRWDCDAVTTARLVVSGSTIVDDDLRDWFDTRVDPEVVWVTASVGWSF